MKKMSTKKGKAKATLCSNCWWNLTVHLECAKSKRYKCDDFAILVGG